jgi:transposase
VSLHFRLRSYHTCQRRDRDLDAWLIQVKHSGLAELKSFAQGIRRDYAAARAAFSSPWRNGQVEVQTLKASRPGLVASL